MNSFLGYLRSKGRYYTVTRPDGRVVHILGVVPGSQASCREAESLLRVIRPDTLYIDTFISRVPRLVGQVNRGSTPKLPTPPSVDVRFDYGLAMSTVNHKYDCDNGIFAMVGIDPDDVWRTGIAESQRSEGCRIIAWPAHYSRRYNNNIAVYDRFGDIAFNVYGNMGFWSNQAMLIALVELTEAKIVDGVSNQLGKVTIPPTGYFTTTAVERMVKQHRQAFDAFAKRNSAESVDFESLLAAQIAQFHDRVARGGPPLPAGSLTAQGKPVPVPDRLEVDEARNAATQMAAARDMFLVQSQTLAGVLMGDDELAELSEEVMERDGGLGLAKHEPWPTRPGTGDHLQQDTLVQETVALVQLPRVAALLRAWEHPIPVSEGLVERGWAGWVLQAGLPVAGVAGFGIAYHRLLVTRFPRASLAVAGVLGIVGGAAYTGSLYVGGYAPYGAGIWHALANPVAPLGSNLGLGARK